MSDVIFRSAAATDLAVIVPMIAADSIAAKREGAGDAGNPKISQAFETIAADPNNDLIVAERDGTVIGVMQLTFIPGLTYEGGTRAQIEGVRIAATERGAGIGRRMIEHAIAKARDRGCALVQLTTDKRRDEAAAFYVDLGFTPSHIGMKMWL